MATVKKGKLDTFAFGLAAGILGAAAGFVVFGFLIAQLNGQTFGRFFQTLVQGSDIFHDKLVTVSILFDVILFFVMIRQEYYNFCKGLLAVVIVSVPVAIYLY
jgi:hypothetical protein